MGHGPPDDGTVRAIHLDISVASKLSGVQFPPNDCVTNENKSRGLKSSKPKVEYLHDSHSVLAYLFLACQC